jgi:drug/metabolite transporter (DMT)-like permease
MNRNHTVTGVTLVVISSVSFGAMALFARLAYAEDVSPVSLLFLRFSLAALIMLGIAWGRRERFPRGRVLLGFALMGGVGYVGQSLAFFTALTMADAGLVALLLYLYPAIVAILSAIFRGERLTGYRITAVVLALAGTAITVGPHLDARPLGVVLGISAALIYSVYIMAGTRLLRTAEPVASSAVIMSAAALVFGGLAAAQGVTLPTGLGGWIGVVGVAIVATVIAVTTFLIGLQIIGPTRASVLSTFEPVTTVVLAALLLGEPIGPWTAIGGALILCGAVMLARSGRPAAIRSPDPGRSSAP